VALEMKRLGFDRVRPLAGGLNAWLDLNYPVVETVMRAGA